MAHYALVAVEWDDANCTGWDALTRALGDAVVTVADDVTEHYRTGRLMPTKRFTLDSARLRDTEAHGIGYRHGYVVHCE